MKTMEKVTNMKEKLSDILLVMSWGRIANHYFNKSSSWLYHKLDGIDGNGKEGGFTPEEALQLKAALKDLALRISTAADNI